MNPKKLKNMINTTNNNSEEFSEWLDYARKELKRNRIEINGFDHVLLKKALQEEIGKRETIDESMRMLLEQVKVETGMKFRGNKRSEAISYLKTYIKIKQAQIR